MTDTTVTSDSDALSPAEQEYFKSGGEQTEALAPKEAEPEKKPPVEGAGPIAADGDKKDDGPEPGELDAEGKPKNPGRWVNHGAFHAERERRKAAEGRINELSEKFSRADERLRLLTEAMQPQQEQAPDPEKDLFGYIKWQDRRIAELSGKVEGTVKQTQEQQAAQKADSDLYNAYLADAREFSTKTADFANAYQHLLSARDRQLTKLGYSAQERQSVIHNEEKGLVQRAIQLGRSPAEMLYELAGELGYKKPEPKVEPTNSAADQIAKIKQGQEASKTLSAAGGSPTDVLTAEALANMSEEDFAAWMAKTPKHQQRSMMGG